MAELHPNVKFVGELSDVEIESENLRQLLLNFPVVPEINDSVEYQ
jgi:hypothetical protein